MHETDVYGSDSV